MPKWLKTIVGVLLLPCCAGALVGLGQAIQASAHADRFWVAAVAGGVCWIVIYALLPRPLRLYVLAHELTHVLTAWVCGRRVHRFRVRAKSGSVTIERPNTLIALAPYILPLYAALVAGGFAVGDAVWGWGSHAAAFQLLLGAAYAFHVTYTAHALSIPQSDLEREGPFFALVTICLGNVLVLVVAVPLLTSGVSVGTALGWCLRNTGHVVVWLAHRVWGLGM